MIRIEKVAGRDVLMESDIPFLKLFRKGKVREVYEIGEYLLIVATDRLSAFDVIMKTGIPDKGIYLTKQSSYWFKYIKNQGYKTHFVTDDIDEIVKITGEKRLLELEWLKGRGMLCKKAEVIPVEAVCRFRLYGSAVTALETGTWIWDPIEAEGELKAGAVIKNGPVFTPTEKSETDDKISFDQMVKIIGNEELASKIKKSTIDLFRMCNEHAKKNMGFEIADGKVEYGTINGELSIIDETFT
ncbi:MAG TPA: phosphoribosylaminoimidazolesuccinocarboxamide synthase, partial [bacterium]|nr:phosphoribosylaminoimidazolesuccinocarboxamide synthase [bacterium]